MLETFLEKARKTWGLREKTEFYGQCISEDWTVSCHSHWLRLILRWCFLSYLPNESLFTSRYSSSVFSPLMPPHNLPIERDVSPHHTMLYHWCQCHSRWYSFCTFPTIGLLICSPEGIMHIPTIGLLISPGGDYAYSSYRVDVDVCWVTVSLMSSQSRRIWLWLT